MTEPSTIGAIRKRRWTAADDEALRRAWPELADERTLRRFALRWARTVVAVNLRAFQIGLRRPGAAPAPAPRSPDAPPLDRGKGGCIFVTLVAGERMFFCAGAALPDRPYCAIHMPELRTPGLQGRHGQSP